MHEASIALSIINIAEEHCKKAGFSKIQSIGVKIGSASGVLPSALLFAFDVAKDGSRANDASLVIEEVPLGGDCRSCKRGFTAEGPFVLECPLCGGSNFTISTGRELDLTDIEVA